VSDNSAHGQCVPTRQQHVLTAWAVTQQSPLTDTLTRHRSDHDQTEPHSAFDCAAAIMRLISFNISSSSMQRPSITHLLLITGNYSL